MSGLPVLIVLRDGLRERVCAVCTSAGRLVHAAQPTEAADSVSSGWAELVVCEPTPGWQALVTRVETAGGAAVLVGPLPPPHERRGVPPEVEHVDSEHALAAALERASARVEARRVDVDTEGLVERVRTAERVNRFAQSIATQIDLPEVVREAVARTRDLCDADGASLLLVDPLSGDLFFDTVAGGASVRIERVRVRSGEGIAGRVAQQAQPMWLEDVRSSPDFTDKFDAASGFQTGSIVAVPLLLSGDVVGVLEAVRGTGRSGFKEGHLRRLEALAPHVTIAVHNAQMAARLRESQAAVVRSNQHLEEKVRERTDQIARGKREWERTFDAISDPIAVQEGFTLVRANLAYAAAAGLAVTALPGRRCHQVFAGRETPCPGCPLLQTAASPTAAEIHGHRGAVFDATSFRDSGSGADRVVVSYRDVTERNLLASRVRESERLAAVGQLASGAAHEINNPLGFVISNLRGLHQLFGAVREHPLPAPVEQELDEAGEMVAESLQGAERVGRIVRALRELSRQEIGRAEPCDVSGSISRILRAELSGHQPAAELSLGARGKAAIAPLQLDQLLGHLVKNARQAVDAGQRISVRTEDRDGEIAIEVSDEGAGIAQEHLHRIFEPFFTTRGVGGGIGLGLTAAYGIARRYGGRIEVRSQPGAGSTFTVLLPRAAEAQPSEPVGTTVSGCADRGAPVPRSSSASWTSASER